jgi:hypothetical protein
MQIYIFGLMAGVIGSSHRVWPNANQLGGGIMVVSLKMGHYWLLATLIILPNIEGQGHTGSL